jgi:hypothetical protein
MGVAHTLTPEGEVFRAGLLPFWVRVALLAVLTIIATLSVLDSLGVGPVRVTDRPAAMVIVFPLVLLAWRAALRFTYEVRFTSEEVFFKSFGGETRIGLRDIQEVELGGRSACVIRHRDGAVTLSSLFAPELATILRRIEAARHVHAG